MRLTGDAAKNPAKKRSVTASERMTRVQEAAVFDTWFREQVQASIDDSRPSVDDDEVRRRCASDNELKLARKRQ